MRVYACILSLSLSLSLALALSPSPPLPSLFLISCQHLKRECFHINNWLFGFTGSIGQGDTTPQSLPAPIGYL